MVEILEKISKITQEKKIVFLVKDIQRSSDVKNENTLEKISDLVNWLYIIDEKDLAIEVANIVDDIPYNEDSTYWDNIKEILVIEILILSENNNVAQVEKIISIIKATYDVGDEWTVRKNHKTLNRILNGSLLYDEKIKGAKERNNIQSEIAWRFSRFKSLVFIYIMGGSETYPIKTLDVEIAKEKQFLKDNIGIAE